MFGNFVGFHSGEDDHGSIVTQNCCFCDLKHKVFTSEGLIKVASKLKSVLHSRIDGFLRGGSDHGSIEIERCWFCCVELMVFAAPIGVACLVLMGGGKDVC